MPWTQNLSVSVYIELLVGTLKILDMSTLPRCKQVLFNHVENANYIASIWKKTVAAKPVLLPVIDHSWNEDGSLIRTSELFPEEVQEIVFHEEFDRRTSLKTHNSLKHIALFFLQA